jgi:hypothetical protein
MGALSGIVRRLIYPADQLTGFPDFFPPDAACTQETTKKIRLNPGEGRS